MRPDLFLATIGRGSNGSNALEVTEDRAAVTAESQDNIINRVNNVSQYGPSWHYVPGIGVAGTAYAEVPGSALGDLAFSRASSKTRTNSAGVVETIGNNVPPHDYRNADGTLSTFPRLNLEPQRTNLNLQSENFAAAYWSKFQSSVTANITAGPDGTLTADKLIEDSTSNFHSVFINTPFSVTIGQPYTRTVYGKADGRNWISLLINDSVNYRAFFDLQNGIVGTVTAGLTASIQDAGNGWYRCQVTRTAATSSLSSMAIELASANGTGSYLGNGTSGVFLWGAQFEAGAYATSYIPTTTAAVTRLADAASKTGVSSLIGQTEGTIFVEFNSSNVAGSSNSIFGISNGTTSSRALIYLASNRIDGQVRDAGATQAVFTGVTMASNTNYKCAIAYKANDVAFYINGTQIGLDTSANIPAMSDVRFDSGGGATTCDVPVNQALLFKTRLTNAQLAELTTL